MIGGTGILSQLKSPGSLQLPQFLNPPLPSFFLVTANWIIDKWNEPVLLVH